MPQTGNSYQIIVSIFGLIVGLFQEGFSVCFFYILMFTGQLFSVQAFPSWFIQSLNFVKEGSLPMQSLHLETNAQILSKICVSLLAKGGTIPQCLAWWCISIFIDMDACHLLKSIQRDAGTCGGHSVECGLLGCWLVRKTVKSYGWFCPWISAGCFQHPPDHSKAEAGCMGKGICPWECCIYE